MGMTAANSSSGQGTVAIFESVAVAIQDRPQVRQQVQSEDLQYLQTKLTVGSSPQVQCAIVGMLGVLCSTEQHSAETNSSVCTTLLKVLQADKSPQIMSQALNALMDMYSDDGHADVFQSLNVLGAFQKMLPIFNKRIRAERLNAPREELDQWQETALNASRFVEYKKGQL